jgi:endonuclease/exonuclease/phosphatase family metal-dependent hydrolase
VARAIRRAAGSLVGGRLPDLIALQEVENREVLLRLRDRYLTELGYRYAVLVAQPGVATQPAFLSRLPVVRSAVHPVGTYEGLPLRHVLEIEVEYQGRALVVLNNHWKAKTGGIARTSEARRRAAAVVERRVRELLRQDPDADVLVVGDLNENVEEYGEARGRYGTALVPWEAVAGNGKTRLPPADGASASADRGDRSGGGAADGLERKGRLVLCSVAELAGESPAGLVLYEPWYELPPEFRGSSVYQGRWQTPDHLLLAPGLFDRRGFDYRPGSFRVVRSRFLLHPQTGFPLGFRAAAGGGRGTSDHLPVLIELELLRPRHP